MANDARAGHTESLFRNVNEKIAEAAEEAPVDDALFVCECDDPGCTAAVHMDLERYDRVRSSPTRFIVKPGHADAAVEHVVEEARSYDVVDKDAPTAADVAERLDPRS